MVVDLSPQLPGPLLAFGQSFGFYVVTQVSTLCLGFGTLTRAFKNKYLYLKKGFKMRVLIKLQAK